MSRCIRNDEGTSFCRKIAVSNINRDALLTFCHQTVKQKGIVDRAAAGTHLAVKLQSLFLICKEKLCVIKHMSDQRGFSVIHTAAGDKFQKTIH